MNKTFLELKEFLPIKEILKVDINELFIRYEEPIKVNPFNPKFIIKFKSNDVYVECRETLYIPRSSKLDKLEMFSGVLISFVTETKHPVDIDDLEKENFNKLIITTYEEIMNHLNPARRVLNEINKD